MYAVIESGGKQYKVQVGDIVQVEKLADEKKATIAPGGAIKFGQVLFVGQKKGEDTSIVLGKPFINGAAVEGEVVGQGRGEKILIIKMKRRKQYRRTQGHRQELTQVLVTSIDAGNGQKSALSADDKKAKLTKFQSHLKVKGPARTAKTLGSRKRLAAAKAAAGKTATTTTTAKKAPAKKKS